MIAGDQGNMGAELHLDDGRFLVHSSDFVSLAYVFRGAGRKPYLATLVGPSGRNMLEAPAADHAHHLGIWWGHGDVNGIDFYLELPRPDLPAGRIEHVDFANIVNDPPQFGFTERLRWQAPDDSTVIEETRILHADFVRDDSYAVDLDSTYTATCPIVFGDTKESVLPGIRLAERLTVNGGGTMTNSHGQLNEAGTMGQPAAWIDCTTERKGLWWNETSEGIACFDHPDNPHHEPTWFAAITACSLRSKGITFSTAEPWRPAKPSAPGTAFSSMPVPPRPQTSPATTANTARRAPTANITRRLGS